jgi:nitrite reductase/ring-hydroxylating ferredoxin subunit
MSETFKQDSRIKVAVVRGSADEQEITALGKIGFLTKVRVFGIDENCAFLDLNLSSSEVYDSEFDLVLCSQVWDHL